MSLTPGVRLGPYEILAPIGAGGMGEVYRARDTRLNRDVAIKILPELFAADADRVARFQREAQVLASLNHPNIAHIHGLEDTGTSKALVLELVDGPTLADLIAKGPIPLDEALPIARQIAEALEAAHEHGIVHRDLKPANIKLTLDGKVKVLDFGLAKAAQPSNSGLLASGLSLSPTITSPAMATHAGIILGTAAYMSPEQARGKVVDRRSDVWAFGCVLYEMLTGQRAFAGDDLTVTMAAIIRAEPDWSLLPADTPESIRRLLKRSLAKERAERLADISAARLEINDALSSSGATASARRLNVPYWAVAAGAVAAIGLLTAAGYIAATRSGTSDSSPIWVSLPLPEQSFGSPSPAVSPDGRTVVYVALNDAGQRTLWLRSLGESTPREIAGTTGASLPFWSPDGRSLGFFSERKLKRVDIDGGSPQVLADAPGPRGGTWGTQGTIVFCPAGGSGLYNVSAAGGGPVEAIRTLDTSAGEQEHASPHFLPDGRRFFYTARFNDERRTGIRVGSLDSPDDHQILLATSRAEYAGGYMFFGREDNLFAQPFDVQTLKISGEPRRLADRLGVSFGHLAAYAFSTSPKGTIVTWSGFDRAVSQLTVVNRSGSHVAAVGVPGQTSGFVLSPDERTIAAELRDPKANRIDVWTMEVSTGVTKRFTAGARTWTGTPVWSPDSNRVLFTDFATNYYIKSILDGRVEQWPHGIKSRGGWPSAWSSDGRYLVFTLSDAATLWDIWLVPVSGDRKPQAYLAGPFSENIPAVSPDSRWMAYVSDEAGEDDVYVNTFPKLGNPIRISTSGGTHPVWRRDGKELYFISRDHQLMSVALRNDANGLGESIARPLFPVPFVDVRDARPQYAALQNGERFVLSAMLMPQPHQNMTVILNWPGLLRD